MKESNSEYEYPFLDFLNDAESFLKSKSHPYGGEYLENFFEKRYADWDFETCMIRSQVFKLSMAFIEEEIHNFDEGEIAVVGRSESLVSRNLLKAIHGWFSSKNIKALTRRPKPSVAEIKAIIEKG
jgi:hypothetical protein